MIVFRISKSEYINDLRGTGARLYGGRWNRGGTEMLYASESRSLATVEFLVHVPASMVPGGLSIASIFIPDDIAPREISLSDLPPDWKNYPAPDSLSEIGTAWAKSNESLLLRVPSAIVEHEFNILINPAHPGMKYVAIEGIEIYTFDNRLLA
jgi:RES domain-containing protein